MLIVRQVVKYPISPAFSKMAETVRASIKTIQKKDHTRTLRLYYAFLQITGSDECDYFSKSSIEAFYGFILTEFDLKIHALRSIFCEARKLPVLVDQKRHDSFNPTSSEDCEYAKSLYKAMPKPKLNYYAGWKLISKDGEAIYLDLLKFHKQFGEDLANHWHREIFKYTRTLNTTTMKTEVTRLQVLLGLLCDLYPNRDYLAYLNSGLEVNEAWEEMYELYKAKYLANNKTSSSVTFLKQWKCMKSVFEEAIIGRGLIAESLYELYTGDGKGLLSEKLGIGKNEKKLIRLLTPLPLHLSDGQVAAATFKQITQDLSLLVECCEQDRNRIIDGVRLRVSAAQIGRISSPQTPDSERAYYENQCATWEHHNYSVHTGLSDFRALRFGLYGSSKSITDELMLLTNQHLLPYIYLLIVEHPFITPGWLFNFELYDKHGRKSNFINDGKVVFSYKPRRGVVEAQQECHLTPKSKSLFEEILLITETARSFLRKHGNDDYRFLLIGSTGAGQPARLKQIPKLVNNQTKSPLHLLLNEKLGVEVTSRITPKSVRATAAVKIYIDTGRIRLMSEALGHKTFNLELLAHYLPDTLRLFFYNRWVRIFQTAITYNAVSDRRCMAQVLGAKTMSNIEEFFENNGLNPLPDYLERGSYGIPDEISAEASSSQLILPIDQEMCNVLVTMARVIRDHQSNGVKFREEVEPWIHTIKFVEASVAMHAENQLRACSNEVVRIFKHAKYIPSLASKLSPIIAHTN